MKERKYMCINLLSWNIHKVDKKVWTKSCKVYLQQCSVQCTMMHFGTFHNMNWVIVLLKTVAFICFFIKNFIANISLYALCWPKLDFGCFHLWNHFLSSISTEKWTKKIWIAGFFSPTINATVFNKTPPWKPFQFCFLFDAYLAHQSISRVSSHGFLGYIILRVSCKAYI